MTFKDRHALETLPARIAMLQADVAKLTSALEDPDLYTRDPARFATTTASLEAARGALASAEEQWLELEMLREELEGGRVRLAVNRVARNESVSNERHSSRALRSL